MTANESETTTSTSDDQQTTDELREDDLQAQVKALRDELETTKNRLHHAEKNLRWMAQHQASETGKSVCPECSSGGSLSVERTATGKKKVECRNCGARLI
ncbi:DUF5320 domain-containing protein [Haladaptatus cibarius]|uniref:DUF5320 domain-containing protein n=1 Tax=Haladaptatus cibarius TaxID=453847 RepID=UPI0006787FFC|nr:DUF5320 domain-containing protein [Haladaptatus cibarius]